MSTFRLPARPEMTVEHCTSLLMGCMQRFVINKDHDSLREFHQLGIPLDFALDCAVKKGNMPTTEFLLYELGVQPSDQTLLNAMRRGQTLRTMFLSRVKPTVRHLNAAVLAEHYDTVDDLIDRFGIKPDHYSVSMMKEGEVSPERTAYINRLITLLPDQDLKREEVMRNLAAYTTPVQYERAIERLGPLPQRSKNKLLSDCLRAAAPAQARVTIQHGAIFETDHLDILGEGLIKKSHGNPKGEWYPVLDTVLEIAIEQDVLFEHSDDAESLCRQLFMRLQLVQAEIQPILDRVSLIARACRPVIRPYVGRTLTDLVNLRLTPRTLPEMRDCLDAFRDHVRQVFGVEVHLLEPEASPAPGM